MSSGVTQDADEQFTGDVSDLNREAGRPTSESWHHIPKLDDADHPLIPEVDYEYIDIEVRDGTTLQEVLTKAMSDPNHAALLVGETGTGKDTAIIKAFSEANWPLVRVNFGSGVTYDELVGHYAPVERTDGVDEEQIIDRVEAVNSITDRLLDARDDINPTQARELAHDALTDDASGFVWQDGLLTKCVRYGWGFCADELNAAEGDVTMPLHNVTESEDNRALVIREIGEVIEPHPQFQFVATMNPVEYAGTKNMNQAFKDRFYPIPVDYMDKEDERTVLMDKTDISEQDAETLTGMASKLRQAKKEGEIMTPVSPRLLVKTARMAEIMPIYDASKMLLEGTAKPGDKRVMMRLVDTYFNKGDADAEDEFGSL